MIRSGDILEIPLANNVGFAYGKIVFSKDISAEVSSHVLLYLYDCFVTESMRDCQHLDGLDWLVNPLLLSEMPKLATKIKFGRCRLLCNQKLKEKELIIPSFREISPNESADTCSVVLRLSNKRLWPVEYSRCAHLGEWIHFDFNAIVWLTTFLGERMGIGSLTPSIEPNWRVAQLKGIAYRMILLREVPPHLRFVVKDL